MWITGVIVSLLIVIVVLLVVVLVRVKPQESPLEAIQNSGERLERGMRDEFSRNREESGTSLRELRGELADLVQDFGDRVQTRMTETAQLQQAGFETFGRHLAGLTSANEEKLDAIRETVTNNLNDLKLDSGQQHGAAREELTRSMKTLGETLVDRLGEIGNFQKEQLEVFSQNFHALSLKNEQKLEAVRETIERKLTDLQTDNTQKLEQMRATVDEKLHATLEQRLGESFKIVSERLEQVHSGLGEMRKLATDVGGLQRVLTNIKTRGCWGEVQLGNLLEQMLTPDQFAKNVATNPTSNERVEFAVKLPGREVDGTQVWLPIDAKFPQEEYQRLGDAQERGDVEAAESAAAALEASVRAEAKKISEKYLNPPHTTDFAIMFLPTEGLFAEVLRRPGVCEGVLRNHRVVLSGPTTLAAVLSSLQMGFRTLSIAQRSSEVWNVLGAVKTEFGKFGAALEKVQKKLHEASTSIDQAAVRSRAVQKQLRKAEEIPASDALKLLELDNIVPDVFGEGSSVPDEQGV